jgi:hypothetical protein
MKTSNYFSYILILIIGLNPSLSFASNSICKSDGYVVGFFNGVWNTRAEALLATAAIRGVIGTEYNEETVSYETFYNHTGSSVDASMFQDVAEVFIQRAEEISPDFAGRFDVFWSTLSGDSDSFWGKVRDIIGGTNELLEGLIEDLYTEISTEVVANISEILSDPPTQSDYERHSTRIKTLATQGTKLILVAHSQGNLFVNNAYNAATSLSNFSNDNIGVIHIAPASSITNGPHVLANLDFVINGLRTFGNHSVPEVTVDIPTSHLLTDPSGHTLIPTYLNTSLDTFGQVKGHLDSEIAKLITPVALGEIGSFTATLQWNGSGDVDLHTFEPSGDHVYWIEKAGQVGYLDVDNTSGYGPEHYFASCDADVLQEGTYSIGVNNYSGADGRTATVQVSTTSIADLVTKSVTLGESRGGAGDDDPIMLININVSKDSEGNFSISSN